MKDGMLEYGSVGVLGFKMHPSILHYSVTPILQFSREENPCILATPALRRINNQRALLERDSSQSSGKNIDVLAIENIRAQIDMPPGKLLIDNHRCAGKSQGGLRYVVTRIALNPSREFPTLILHAVRADQHTIAAGLVDCFHDQLIQV